MNKVLIFLIFFPVTFFTEAQNRPTEDFDIIVNDIQDTVVKQALKAVDNDKKKKNANYILNIAKYIVKREKESAELQSKMKRLIENKKQLNQTIERLKAEGTNRTSPPSKFSSSISQNFKISAPGTPKYEIIESIQRLENYSSELQGNIPKISTEIEYLNEKGIYWSSQRNRVVIEYTGGVRWNETETRFIENLIGELRQVPQDYNEIHAAYLKLLRDKVGTLELSKLRERYTKPIQRQYIDAKIGEFNR